MIIRSSQGLLELLVVLDLAYCSLLILIENMQLTKQTQRQLKSFFCKVRPL